MLLIEIVSDGLGGGDQAAIFEKTFGASVESATAVFMGYSFSVRIISTIDANQRGGETYRVGVTGKRNRRGFLRPRTPHHNANVAVRTTIKKTLARL